MSRRTGSAVAAVLGWWAASCAAGCAPGTQWGQVVRAWEKSGADAGWMEPGETGYMSWHGREFGSVEMKWQQGNVPAFAIAKWRDGMLSQLPPPGQPFGLCLSYTEVTDAGLKELAGLKQLQALVLDDCGGVTDGGVKQLAGLGQLQSLELNLTGVTDAGLKDLAGLRQLQRLGLNGTKVTDAGVKELAGLKQLLHLGLSHTQVTDAGVKELAGLEQLQTLDLMGCKGVTDAGMSELAGLKQLRLVYVIDTQVTDEGVAELKKALPEARIYREVGNGPGRWPPQVK